PPEALRTAKGAPTPAAPATAATTAAATATAAIHAGLRTDQYGVAVQQHLQGAHLSELGSPQASAAASHYRSSNGKPNRSGGSSPRCSTPTHGKQSEALYGESNSGRQQQQQHQDTAQ